MSFRIIGLPLSLFAIACSGTGTSPVTSGTPGDGGDPVPTSDGGSPGTGPEGGPTGGGPDGGTPVGADGGPLREPREHRVSSPTCPAQRGAGGSLGNLPGTCQSDAECTSGTNGRCLRATSCSGPCSIAPPACSYDECANDTGCSGLATCGCRPDATSSAANTCQTAGNCRIDGDCGVGGYCSPLPRPCGGFDGYYCHTKSDECTDDSDCTNGQCGYDSAAHHWKCGHVVACPV